MEHPEVITFWISVLGAVLLFSTCLAMPAYLRTRSKWMLARTSVSLVLFVLLPVFIFLVSDLLTPESQGAIRFGWLDCFHHGKLALSPLVLWAVVAFYALVVLDQTRLWVALGLLQGSVVAAGCTLFGFVVVPLEHELSGYLLVPLGVTVVYGGLAGLSLRRVAPGATSVVTSFLAAVPFWFWSLWWSRKTCLALPTESNNCFVVTAASEGHVWWVGPHFEIERGGERRWATRQLVTFWRLESEWQAKSPRSHRLFRKLYNRVGPLLARRIRGPVAAYLAYLLLKPAELAAGVVSWGLGAVCPRVRPGP